MQRLTLLPVNDPFSLLNERAMLNGWSPRGQISHNGTCRLLRAADEWIALSTPRQWDLDVLPAWLEVDIADSPDHRWRTVATAVASRSAADLRNRAELLDLPVAIPGEIAAAKAEPIVVEVVSGDAAPLALAGASVVNLSTLWAGPLCASLLQQCGAHLITVENTARPDGARDGNQAFFDRLHTGEQRVHIDFDDERGLEQLHALVAAADIVITSARKRALDRLGLDAHAPGGPKVWIAITGYGLASPRVAFGDDAAAAGNWLRWHNRRPEFAGDALADPMTGMVAAATAIETCARKGRFLLDAALARVAAHAAGTQLDA